MAQTGSYTYEKGIWKQDFLKSIRAGVSKRELVIICVGFFLAMAMPLPGIAPFGIAYLAQEKKLRLRSVLLFLVVSLGSFVACGRLGCAKYASAGLIYLSCLFILKRGIKISDTAAGIIAAIAVFVSGFAALIIEGISLLGVILLLCEGAVVVSGTLMMEKSIETAKQQKFLPENLDSDTKLSLGAVVLIALLGFKEVYLGSSLSIMMVMATVMLLVISAGCGAGYSTGAGVILGIVCGIGSDFFMPILGAFSFCGFLAGVFAKFGKCGVIAGVVLANGIMAVYTSSAMEAVLSIYEVVVASVVFGFVPKSWTDMAGAIFSLDEGNRESIIKIKSGLRSRLNAVAAAFDNMAKTMDKLSSKAHNDDADVAVLFDATADKVCTKCRKATVCWGRDFDDTYGEMFKLLEVLKAKGVVKAEDIPKQFDAKCVNTAKFLEELNHQFDIYRVRQVWHSKISESRKLVGKQLGGMSEIIEKITEDIDAETGKSAVSAYQIRSRLELAGIKVKDINVMQDRYERCRIELTVKTDDAKGKGRRNIEKIIKSLSGCSRMDKEEILENKKLMRLVFSEEEKFIVETEHSSRAADKENGDNFRLLHLKGGKFVIAISDGMGTGSRAARESEAILELLDSFLDAGFDSRVAIRLINSIMIMKSENEAFVTLDLCIIDLYTGEVRFIKTGAEPSFILNRSGRVRTVKATSLPVGLIADAEAEVSTTKIQDGDRIVMMTDGISMSKNGEPWLDEFIREEKYRDEKITDEILNRAIEKNNGTVKDDMTVVAVRLKAVS
ncbi:MAG: stage II sporulation protein E [Clostridia bacterium]|nr:stage II sporulation protein E [Clostridia bacterium]